MKKILFSVLFMTPWLISAQTTLSTVAEAMEFAKKNNRDIQISESKTSMEKENIKIANSALLPQIKGISNFEYNYALPVQLIPAEFLGGQPGDYRKLQFGTKYNWTAGVEASMPLISTSFWTDRKISYINYEASKQSFRNVEFETMKQVARGYYLSLLSAKSLRISEENMKIADSLHNIAESRYTNGAIDPLEYNRIITTWLRAKNDLERNTVVFINNRNSLKYYLGLKQEDSLTLTENISKVPSAVSLTGNHELYPSVREKQLLSSSGQLSMRREKYKRIPEISLYGRYLNQAQRNEMNFFDSNLPWFNIGVVGLRFEVPLFTGFTRSSHIHRAVYKYEIQKMELEKEIEKVKIEDQELINNLRNSTSSANNLVQSYELSEKNLQIALFKYKEGLFSLDQYLNVMNESLSLQGQFLNTLSELYSTKTIIELKNNLQ